MQRKIELCTQHVKHSNSLEKEGHYEQPPQNETKKLVYYKLVFYLR